MRHVRPSAGGTRQSVPLCEFALRVVSIHGEKAQDFANCRRQIESVLRFTKQYGPLYEEPSAGGGFAFALQDWTNAQEGIRGLWETLLILRPEQEDLASWGRFVGGEWETAIEFEATGVWHVVAGPGDGLAYVDRQLVYRTGTLWRFLLVDC